MRFAIRRDRVWRQFGLLAGASAGRSWVEISGGELRARYGWLFDRRFPLSSVNGAARRSWPLLLGWRYHPPGIVGLIGSRSNVVEITFDRSWRAWTVFPFSYSRLAVSLEDLDGFLAALEEAAREAGGWKE